MNGSTIRIGLRFRRGQAKVIEAIADQVRPIATDPHAREAVGILEKAAEAARRGEPLIVTCRSADEVEQMADDFVRYGIARPAVEDLGLVT